MPHNTDEDRGVSFFRMTDENPEKFDFLSFLKLYSLVTDTRAASTYPSDGLFEGNISVFDCNGFRFGHFMKMLKSFSLMRLFLKYGQECLPHVLYQNHFINCSSVITRIMALIRPFLTKEVTESMFFHQGHEALHKHLSRKVLPLEYGGEAGKIDEIYGKTVEILEQLREYLNDESSWKLSN